MKVQRSIKESEAIKRGITIIRSIPLVLTANDYFGIGFGLCPGVGWRPGVG